MVDRVWLIPGLPLAGALFMLLAGRKLPGRIAGIICSATVLGSFLLGISQPAAHVVFGPWLPLAGADWGFLIDRLSRLMIALVCGVSFLIHVYSIAYMEGEGEYRFFGYMNLFVACMLVLVMADNYGLLFLGWEGVGLCSYLLIGFYYKRRRASAAAIKAFLVNRAGDAALLTGLALLITRAGSLRFGDLARLEGPTTVIALLLLAGAAGKSAQFPLHIWLPDAMEGPTPVSALIHAATMVTAGVYLIARSAILFDAAPLVQNIVAILGAFTALLAASIALAQTDIKRVLAYSTISQLGLMFVALGVGAYWAAIFHLFTHAFFKALLFLGAGSVIHALSGEQNLLRMGGLRTALPYTHAAMLIGALAIAGIPGLAGFFSKDEILAAALHAPLGSAVLFAAAVLASLMTAWYMWRLMRLTFYGETRSTGHPHESPGLMLGPLAVLSLGSIAAGWIWPREHMDWTVAGIAFASALAGITLARLPVAGRIGQVLLQGWYFDELFHRMFVRGGALRFGSMLARFDGGVVDGGVNGSGVLTRLASRLLILWDTWVVDGGVRLMSAAVRLSSYPARVTQSGQLQAYALVFVAGMLVLFGVFLVR